MIRQLFLISVICTLGVAVKAQNTNKSLPYAEIPAYPEVYNAGTVAARMVDGLGFRFYWATEGLRDEDLKYRPNTEARSSEETIDHIYEMSIMIANAVKKEANGRTEGLTFQQKRAATLNNLKVVADILRNSSDQDMENYQIKFGNGTSFPFWNLINGPIADCLWHCGQIVSFRRASGNPFNSNVSVFNGKLRE
ncbi:hypothetical protein C900_05006 [Fulvivirga imtechensis AK7]|uniref:DinB-like domain-containing protein n=1 Tax=Fulvivirga imtechensis AK7 TaxID=1237149 RepID=L8JPN4_9BACT|nr:hypothetical protein [Fulvivirga imtechensis]ELR69474.1 hypothetical protein C900_05006 [Fulvivirga imtechensis AK7]